MDEKEIKKFIYFPGFGDAQMRPGYPELLYVSNIWKDVGRIHLSGNRIKEELLKGRKSYFYGARAFPFTEEGWELCMDYKKRRTLIEAEEKELKKKIKKLARSRK